MRINIANNDIIHFRRRCAHDLDNQLLVEHLAGQRCRRSQSNIVSPAHCCHGYAGLRRHRYQQMTEHAHCWSPACHRLIHRDTKSQVKTHTGKHGGRQSCTPQYFYYFFILTAITKSALITYCHTRRRYKYPHATQSESVVYPQAAVPHSHSTEACVPGESVCERQKARKSYFKPCIWTTERVLEICRERNDASVCEPVSFCGFSSRVFVCVRGRGRVCSCSGKSKHWGYGPADAAPPSKWILQCYKEDRVRTKCEKRCSVAIKWKLAVRRINMLLPQANQQSIYKSWDER